MWWNLRDILNDIRESDMTCVLIRFEWACPEDGVVGIEDRLGPDA